MNVTPYSEVNQILEQLINQLQAVLGNNLVGLYLCGSLVWGDFDPEISDVDLMAATGLDINKKEFAELNEMQAALIGYYPKFDNRLEIAYISINALRTFKTKTSPIAIISPGEPFHIKEAGADWLINWYLIREKGVTLFGPSPTQLIGPISKEEFVAAVRRQAADWREWIVHTKDSRPYQGYAILTMCRALYACQNGDQASKKQAALWAIQKYPSWAEQIQKALQWRKDYRNQDIDPTKTYPETVQFVNEVIDFIANAPGV
jgi:predicted nucleotidyltransferase